MANQWCSTIISSAIIIGAICTAVISWSDSRNRDQSRDEAVTRHEATLKGQGKEPGLEQKVSELYLKFTNIAAEQGSEYTSRSEADKQQAKDISELKAKLDTLLQKSHSP